MTQVAGKVAFITGGGSGVGFGQASVFAAAGCKIAIADIRQDHLDQARDELIEPAPRLWPATDIVPFHFHHPVTGKAIRIDNSRAREGFEGEK